MTHLKPLFLLTFMGSLTVSAQPRFVPDTDIKKVGEIEFQMPKRFSFGFTNKGDQPLIIKEVHPSCSCIDVTWPKTPVAAGARGEVTLTYDAKLLGSFYRDVEIITNAPADTSYIAMQGTVVTEVHDYSDAYPIDLGSVRMMTNTIEFDDVNKGDHPTAELSLINTDRSPYKPELMHLPPYLTADYLPESVPAGKQGIIRLTLDSEKLDQMGLNQTSIYLSRYPGDKIGDVNEVLVEAVLLPSFSGLTEEELEHGPLLSLSETNVDLGSLNGKKELKQTVLLTNTGERDLNIQHVQVSGKAVTVSLSDRIIRPGRTAKLKLGVSGKYLGKSKGRMRVLLITDDPKHAKQFINIEAKP